ncbi:MAG TPA: hypothetical protein VFV93_10245 [Thermomicrobiales bacterium]|nr:hypothetical protein [Thermomicrobiales bacterium]
MSLPLPILHASGFSWDEALVLVIAILAVPAISFFTGRFGKRRASESASRKRHHVSEPAADDAVSDPTIDQL